MLRYAPCKLLTPERFYHSEISRSSTVMNKLNFGLLFSMSALALLSPGYAIAENKASATTSSDYHDEELSISPGHTGTEDGEIDTKTEKKAMGAGVYGYTGGDGSNEFAGTTGITVGGTYRKFKSLRRYNDSVIGSENYEDAEKKKPYFKSGIPIQPGVDASLNYNLSLHRFDAVDVNGTVGGAYRIWGKNKGMTGDVKVLPIGAVLTSKAATEMTQAGLSIGLFEVSGHMAFEIKNTKNGAVTTKIPVELCFEAKGLDMIIGYAKALGHDESSTVSLRPLMASVCAAVGIHKSVGTLKTGITYAFNVLNGASGVDRTIYAKIEDVGGVKGLTIYYQNSMSKISDDDKENKVGTNTGGMMYVF